MTQPIKEASIDTYERALKWHQNNLTNLKSKLSQLDCKIEACENNINYKDRRTDFVKFLQDYNTQNKQLQNIESCILELKAKIKACKSR